MNLEKIKIKTKFDKQKYLKSIKFIERAEKIESSTKRKELYKKALETSEYCTGAYIALAEEAGSLVDALQYKYKAMIAEKTILGEKFFEENKGELWMELEARLYLELKFFIMEDLWELGYKEKAIEYGVEILDINKNDNQGVRYAIMPWLILANNKRI